MKKSLKLYEMTEGAFDITIGRLVDYWGFGSKKIADSVKLEDIFRKTGIEGLFFNDSVIVRKIERLKLI
jgi:thiamine biosynthesis lipoprotein ApbE